MVTIDVEKLKADFLTTAEAYSADAELMRAMDLDDASLRLMSAAGYLLHNEPLIASLHELRKLVRSGKKNEARVQLHQVIALLESSP